MEIELLNEQDIEVDEPFLQRAWQHAAGEIISQAEGELGSELTQLKSVCMVLLSDEKIAEVHGEFLADPTPTDVITFHHGEVLISVETAARVATQLGETTEAEVLLYGIHGLVHLHGYSDLDAEGKALMEEVQNPLWQELKRSS